MRDNEGQTPKKSDHPHIHVSCFWTAPFLWFDSTVLSSSRLVWLHVPLALECSTQLPWTWLGLGLGSAPLDSVHCCFVPHLLPAPVSWHACFSELSSIHCLELHFSSGVGRDRQQERDRVCSTGPRKKQNKMVHFCCTFLLLLKPGPPAMVCKVQNSNHSTFQQTWDTSAHQHSKEHPPNKCPRGGKQRERVRWGRKKLPLPLPSPLLVLTNEPLASPNYLAQATASSLLSKPRLQPNIRKLASWVQNKGSRPAYHQHHDISESQAALSFITFDEIFTARGHGTEPTYLNHSLQSLKANYYPLVFLCRNRGVERNTRF